MRYISITLSLLLCLIIICLPVYADETAKDILSETAPSQSVISEDQNNEVGKPVLPDEAKNYEPLVLDNPVENNSEKKKHVEVEVKGTLTTATTVKKTK